MSEMTVTVQMCFILKLHQPMIILVKFDISKKKKLKPKKIYIVSVVLIPHIPLVLWPSRLNFGDIVLKCNICFQLAYP